MTGSIETGSQTKISFAERLGMHPELAIGYLGLLLFMIGDGVEAGFLSLMLTDMRFGTAKVALVFTRGKMIVPNEINQRLGIKPFVTASPKLHATGQ